VGKGVDSLVKPLNPELRYLVKHKGKDNGNGKLNCQPSKTYKAGIKKSTKESGIRKDIPEIPKIIPGTAGDPFGKVESFERQLDTIHWRITEYRIPGGQRQYQKVNVPMAVDTFP
jgi:hypothetical protein